MKELTNDILGLLFEGVKGAMTFSFITEWYAVVSRV